MATIKLIPPAILPKDVRLVYEQEQPSTPRSPTKRGAAKGKTPKGQDAEPFTRVPMITVKDIMRNDIEANVCNLVGTTVADAMNKRIEEAKEAEAEARRANIKTPIVTDITESEKQDDYQQLGNASDLGGVGDDSREDFMQRLEVKQAKRAEDAEKRERAASAKRKKREEMQQKKEEADRQKELRKQQKLTPKRQSARQVGNMAKKKEKKTVPSRTAAPPVEVNKLQDSELEDMTYTTEQSKKDGGSSQHLPGHISDRDHEGFKSDKLMTEQLD